MNEELKPCPFCGKSAKVYTHLWLDGSKRFRAMCIDPNCWCMTSDCHSPEAAKHLWNTRPGENQLQAELQAAREQLTNAQSFYATSEKVGIELLQAAREDAERLAKKGAHISRCLRVLVDYDKMNPGLDRTSEEGALKEWKAALTAHEALKGGKE